MFIDMCHPDEIGQSRLAQLVLDAVKAVAPEIAKDARTIEDLRGQRGSKPAAAIAPPSAALAALTIRIGFHQAGLV
jgi:hypothetical protein